MARVGPVPQADAWTLGFSRCLAVSASSPAPATLAARQAMSTAPDKDNDYDYLFKSTIRTFVVGPASVDEAFFEQVAGVCCGCNRARVCVFVSQSC